MLKDRKEILVVIITFNPDIEFLKRNIEKFKQSNILIVDNSSANSDKIRFLLNNTTIKGIFNQQNLGIAEALNQGLRYATRTNYKYILTMDQDSSFKDNYLNLLNGFKENANVGIVSPSIFDVNSKNIDIAKDKHNEIFIAITSGCLCDIAALNDVGGFNSKLFIDYVDYEICLKLQLKNYKILRLKSVILNHSLGESKVYVFFGVKFISTNHNKLRRYYNSRNRIYLLKNYFLLFPTFFIHNQLSFLKTIFIIILFENEKYEKLKSIMIGIYHGIRMN